MGPHFLNRLFSPESIAVFGASDDLGSVGGRVFANLRQGGFSGGIYAVNPKHEEVQGQTCYDKIEVIGGNYKLVSLGRGTGVLPTRP